MLRNWLDLRICRPAINIKYSMFLERNEILPCFVIYDISMYFMCELDQTARWEYEEEKVTGAYPQQTNQSEQFNEQTNQTLLTNSSPTVGKSTRLSDHVHSAALGCIRFSLPFYASPKQNHHLYKLSSSAMHWHLQYQQRNPQEQKKAHLKETKNNTSKSNIFKL